MQQSPVAVNIEFRRIQRFLFAVPRLRDMIGANVLLGELIREHLPALVSQNSPVSLQLGMEAPPVTDPLTDACAGLKPSAGVTPTDDPGALYQAGILSRDGGHFRAIFANGTCAEEFGKAASSMIATLAPGLAFDLDLVPQEPGSAQPSSQGAPAPCSLASLPSFEICHETGSDVAVRPGPDGTPVGLRAQRRREAGNRFASEKDSSKDIIGLLRRQLPGSSLPAPRDMDDLSDHGYVALIEADGNRIGDRRRRWVKSQGDDSEAANETFFWHMRVAFRHALVAALRQVFTASELERHTACPYQLLMLGGDDLLLVTQPRYALPLVKHMARRLEQCPVPWQKDERRPITMAAGVAIASASYPFHALHALASELTASAKQIARVRQLVSGDATEIRERSVVDWMVTTSSLSGSVLSYRRANEACSYTVENESERLAYTGRPYRVLAGANLAESNAPAAHALDSLEGMLQATDGLMDAQGNTGDASAAARSQLKRLAATIRAGGRRAAELAFAGLQPALRETLKERCGIDGVFAEVSGRSGHYVTPVADVVELAELHRLGTKTGADE